MRTPVVIIFFNRMGPLKRLVARLSNVQPQKVYLISDGPRDDHEEEAGKVAECREFMKKLPWACDLRCNLAEKNMGCRERVISGLDWVFGQEEQAVILEDDCIPELEFFPWVETMLNRYADNPKVLSIGGTNLCPYLCDKASDVVFSKYATIWGWATWRRAWSLNDKNLELLREAVKTHRLKRWLGSWRAEWYWRYLLSHVKSSWGYRWAFTHFAYESFCALPPVNLVTNIGMTDVAATHTSNNPYNLPRADARWNHAVCGGRDVISNVRLDAWIEDNHFSRSLANRLVWCYKHYFNQGGIHGSPSSCCKK